VIAGLIIFLLMVLIVSSLPIFRSNVINARGVFITYLIFGALIPALTFIIQRITDRSHVPHYNTEFYSYFSIQTMAYAIFMIFLFATLSLYFARIFEGTLQSKSAPYRYTTNGGVSLIFSMISIISSILYVAIMTYLYGSLSNFYTAMYERVRIQDSIVNLLSIIFFSSYIFSIFSIYFIGSTSNLHQKIMSIFSVTLAIAVTFSTGGRSMVVLYLFAIAYRKITRMKVGSLAIFSGLFILIVSILSYVMLSLRFFYQGTINYRDDYAEGFSTTASVGLNFLDSVAGSIEFVKGVGHDFGQSYLNMLGQPIPRQIWEGKPLQLSIRMREYFAGDTTGGLPATLIGESYIAFGLLGPILAAVIFGWMLERTNRVCAIAIAWDCRARFAVAGIFVPLIGFVLVRSGFDTAFSRLLIPAFWCVVAYWIARPARRFIVPPNGHLPAGMHGRYGRTHRRADTVRRP
jgi:oligosaccharide repeat unit polymerase